MDKLCVIFSHASVYREPIYRLIDTTFECEWHFSDEDGGVRRFDTNTLKNVTIHKHTQVKKFHWISGINKLLCKKDNNTFLMLAGTVDLSCWLFYFRAKLFYPKKKIYLWGHGWYGKESYIQKLIKKIFFRKVDGFFLYGDYAKSEMIKEGFEINKLHVIKNSLDYDKQLELRNNIYPSDVYKRHFKNDYPTIIFIGRLTQVKKLDQIVKAVGLLQQRGEHYNIVFVGDGKMHQMLEAETVKYHLQDNVWFYGACFDEKMNAEFIYNADLCVAPGNIGLTAMHVLMFGCPAISHNDFKWQMPEFEAIIPGKTGDFFEYDNVDDLARCISQWFTSKKNSREDVRLACYKEIDEYWNPHYQLNLIRKTLDI